jgi:acyl-CoA thioesterase-1
MMTFAAQLRACCSVAAISAAASCNGPTSPSRPIASAAMPVPTADRIVVLGDSLAVSPSRMAGFPSYLQQLVDAAALPFTVVNAGVGGDTTGDGLRRFDRAVPADARILVLELGANDGLRGVPLPTIENNLSQMIERAQSRGMRVLLCGMETPPSHGWQYTLDYHGLFPRIAARYDVPLVPFLLAGVALNPELNGQDEVHPNAAGAQRIAQTVWPYLKPLLQVTAATPSR